MLDASRIYKWDALSFSSALSVSLIQPSFQEQKLTGLVLVFWHTIEWFTSLLAQCVPLVAAWDLSRDNTALCMSQSESEIWAMANYCKYNTLGSNKQI